MKKKLAAISVTLVFLILVLSLTSFGMPGFTAPSFQAHNEFDNASICWQCSFSWLAIRCA